MAHDPWQQWQQFASLWGITGPRSGEPGGPGFTPLADAAAQFQGAVRAFFDRTAHGSAPAAGEAAHVFADFLRDRFGEIQMPWSTAMGGSAGIDPAPSGGDSPAFGASREHQQRMQRMIEAARRLDEAQRRLQRLWADALREAATGFTARLAASEPGVPGAEAWRVLYDSWIDCAEDAYARMAHGEAFCGALADYVNASSQWRRELQVSIEYLGKLLDLPTRSEVNALIERVDELEQRLRDTRKPTSAPSSPLRPKRAARRAAKP